LNDLTLKYEMAADEVDTEKQKSQSLSAEVSGSLAQAKSFQRELKVMNTLLTQMLLGPIPDDLDGLTELLQQNHVLISQITACEDCSDVAAELPRLLLDLLAQVSFSSTLFWKKIGIFSEISPL